MHVMGRWNWWAPKPLAWLHDRFGISEAGDGGPARLEPPAEQVELPGPALVEPVPNIG
jgi:RND superfamily putative drug exporter